MAVRNYTLLSGEPRKTVLNSYRGMGRLLARKGLPSRQPFQTPREYVNLVAPALEVGLDLIEWISQAANAAAYDPRPVSVSTAKEAREKLAALRRGIVVRTS